MNNPTESVRVKVTTDTLQFLKRDADESERSVSATIRLAISEYRRKKEKKR